MADKSGYIYILTNPSFPEYVKIGYADDVEDRVKTLNSRECTPFAFRIYATYKVSDRLKDIPVHQIIDQLNPTLRSKEEIDGKLRIREFYAMSPEAAYLLLERIAKINGLEENLTLYEKTKTDEAEEENAEEVRELKYNRHHFKDITFTSSLTGKTYDSRTKEDGSLGIYEHVTGNEVISFSNPSKKQIVRTALIDLGEEADNSKNLYQLIHQLEKNILNK